MKLVTYKNDGIELVIDHSTGEAFATIRGYARMSGISFQAISKRVKGVNQKQLKTSETLTTTDVKGVNQGVAKEQIKTAEIPTLGGLQGVALIPAELVFKWAVVDNPSLAIAMGTAGATVYLHRLAGFEWQQSPVKQKEPTMLDYAKALIAAHETIDNLQTSVDELLEENAELAPKAQAYDFYFNAEGLTSIEEFAKTVCIPGVGRNKMFVLLRELMIIQKNSTLPYQSFVPRYFVVRPEVLPSGTTYNRAFLTKEGVQLLLEKLELI